MKTFKKICRVFFCLCALILIFVGINTIRYEIFGININHWFLYADRIDFYSSYVYKSSIRDIILTLGFIGFCLYYIIESIFVLFPSLKASKTEKVNKKRAKLQKKIDKLNTEIGE